MSRTASSEISAELLTGRAELMDIGAALDLLAWAVVNERAGPHRSLVRDALLEADVTIDQLDAMRGHRLGDLYRASRMPVALTLGALIVLDAAQRSEDSGSCGDDVLDAATAAAAKFLELVAPLVPEC